MISQPRFECPDCGHGYHYRQCHVIWMGERCECDAPPVRRPGPCPHPKLSDQLIRDYSEPDRRSWGEVLHCLDCGEHIYPHQDIDDEAGLWVVVAYTEEPYGAGSIL